MSRQRRLHPHHRPVLLFTSYTLRITVVAKRTLAIDPLILRESQR